MSDYKTLMALVQEMDTLSDELAVMQRTLVYKENPYLSDQENKQVEFLLFRFMNARDALLELIAYYRTESSSDPDLHIRGAVVGMSAALNLSFYNSYFIALFQGQKNLIKMLNTEHPRYEIPANLYQTVYDNVTSIDHLERMELVWYLFCKELANPESNLLHLQSSEPLYRSLISKMDGLHNATRIQTEYVMYASHYHLPDLQNRLHHSEIVKLGDEIATRFDEESYKTRGLVFKNVARIKKPNTHLLQFSDDQIRQIKTLLQPGDILLTYSAGYMSNIFLPGNFKHGITYVGTIADRRQAGLTDELLLDRAVSDKQGQELIAFVTLEKTPDGDEMNVVEAVAEGVILNSLDTLLKTHINRLAVIRPRISEQERLEQLVILMQYAGAPYDFKFDFQDDTNQCCTELVYRAINKKGTIDFSLVKMKGIWILAADDILRYYLIQNPEAFEFILLADQPTDSTDYHAEIKIGEDGLAALYELMQVKKP